MKLEVRHPRPTSSLYFDHHFMEVTINMLVRIPARRVLLTLLTAALMLTACNMGATPAPTVDVNAINTAAYNTAAAQISAGQTQTALAAPTEAVLPTNASALPTFALPGNETVLPTTAGGLPTVSFNSTPLSNTTPLAGLTPLATFQPTSAGIGSTASGCNDALFVGETLPDKSVIKAGEKFTKAWEIKNTGTCDWAEGYTFAFQANLSSSAISGYDIVIKSSDEVTEPGHSQSFVVKLTAPTTAGEYKGYWKMKDDKGNFFGPLVFLDIVVK